MNNRADYKNPFEFFKNYDNIIFLISLAVIQIILLAIYTFNSVFFSYRSVYWRRYNRKLPSMSIIQSVSLHSYAYSQGRRGEASSTSSKSREDSKSVISDRSLSLSSSGHSTDEWVNSPSGDRNTEQEKLLHKKKKSQSIEMFFDEMSI